MALRAANWAAAEYVGGIPMVVFSALIFRLSLTPHLVEMVGPKAERGRRGRIESHASMT
jgi:hypothetical protein